jgi:hypothetical protein
MTVAEIERIGSPEIPKAVARGAFLEYRRAVVHETDRQRKREYQAITRGYQAIAKGQQVIDLQKVMHVAGLQDDTKLPKLAICRADAAKCRVWMSNEGGAEFGADVQPNFSRSRRRCVRFPEDTFEQIQRPWDRKPWRNATAIVPMIPPHLKPKVALTNYHILWDAVWTKEPPVDPLLLKHCGGMLYAIVAAWDLTPLEQAVMRGRL